jgi:hypothetical protein
VPGEQPLQGVELLVGWGVGHQPEDVVDAERTQLGQVAGHLLDRTGQRLPLVERPGGDRPVHLDHHRHRARIVPGGLGRAPERLEGVPQHLPGEHHLGQAEPQPRRPLHRRRGRGARQQRRPARGHGLGPDLGLGDPVEAPVEADGVRTPDRAHRLQVLLEAGAAARRRHAGRDELLRHPSLAQADQQPAAAEAVQGGQPPGQPHRAVEQRVEHAGAQPDAAGDGGDVAERLQRVVDGRVVLGQRHRADAEHVRLGRAQPALEGPDRGQADALGALGDLGDRRRRRVGSGRGQGDTELHRALLSLVAALGCCLAIRPPRDPAVRRSDDRAGTRLDQAGRHRRGLATRG